MRPGMSDGRAFTSYVSSCQLNENIKESNNIQTDSAYRQFLQKSYLKADADKQNPKTN